jgi:hypothetical protein
MLSVTINSIMLSVIMLSVDVLVTRGSTLKVTLLEIVIMIVLSSANKPMVYYGRNLQIFVIN